MIYLSFGAGVQSTALLAMSALGLKGCPKADVAIFADTQAEPELYVCDACNEERPCTPQPHRRGMLCAECVAAEEDGPQNDDWLEDQVTYPKHTPGDPRRTP